AGAAIPDSDSPTPGAVRSLTGIQVGSEPATSGAEPSFVTRAVGARWRPGQEAPLIDLDVPRSHRAPRARSGADQRSVTVPGASNARIFSCAACESSFVPPAA